jgi:L,D-transpeptidase ErfK/SrfK
MLECGRRLKTRSRACRDARAPPAVDGKIFARLLVIPFDMIAIRFRPVTAVLAAVLLAVAPHCAGRAYLLPSEGDGVVGAVSIILASRSDTISDLALAWNQGYRELRAANPDVDPWLPADGVEVVIPSRYVLPSGPREDIVINVPEMRLYYYPKPKPGEAPVVITHPISIGRQEWTTPHGVTTVVAKAKDPTWYPPESIREEHAAEGDILPRVVAPGPDNPLGRYALRLGIRGYLIHGTNKLYGLGMRVTHGCIRMYPEDIEHLFHDVRVGARVRIINEPNKVAISDDEIYIEVHPRLDEERSVNEYSQVVDRVIALAAGRQVNIDWNSLRHAIEQRRGVPVAIGTIVESAPTELRPVADAAAKTRQQK